jgi:hypothetical protein
MICEREIVSPLYGAHFQIHPAMLLAAYRIKTPSFSTASARIFMGSLCAGLYDQIKGSKP